MRTSRWYLLFFAFIVAMFPEWALAQDTSSPISFSPPPGDISLTYLTNIFGMVDGVLHGGGSQMLGSMFGIFNAAVLALGGIILLYTILVATLNTAGQGEVLGKNWSSIWIPIRTTVGISLLMTKSSGYSVMQIFIMWVVVQGVGAADLVWGAALSYMQRGGVIVQPTADPAKAAAGSDKNFTVIKGASAILTGVTCMTALQQQLELLRSTYMEEGNLCDTSSDSDIQEFCDTPVPDFLGSVDALQVQTDSSSSTYTMSLPNFSSTYAPYNGLNGVCGAVTWKRFISSDKEDEIAEKLGLTQEEADMIANSRAIAIQQIFSDYSSVAQSMVANTPLLMGENICSSQENGSVDCYIDEESTYYKAVAPFGIPTNAAGIVPKNQGPIDCQSYSKGDDYTDSCVNWQSPETGYAPLLNGTEFQGAINDYNSIMLSSLNAVQNTDKVESSMSFADEAQSKGWITAGTYFYDLVNANQSMQNSTLTDSNTGLDKSVYPDLSSTFCERGTSILCTWYGSAKKTYTYQIINLIRGPVSDDEGEKASKPSFSSSPAVANKHTYSGPLSATVYGYIANASNVVLPGQQGTKPPDFDIDDFMPADVEADFKMDTTKKGCQKIWIFKVCIIRDLVNIVITILNFFLAILADIFNAVIAPFFVNTFFAMWQIIADSATKAISDTTQNPIVVLAEMGNYYINSAMDIWFKMAFMLGLMSLIPGIHSAIVILIMILGPILLCWLAIFFGIGFLTAYYVPLLPYMMFSFGAIGWLIGVIEAMVASPMVALGLTIPEGQHEVFGKVEHALMLILNVFLRPSMMIIGYIAAIILSYVSVWIINTGFQHVLDDIIDMGKYDEKTSWSGYIGYFAMILVYTSMYITVVQKSFTLIYILPDRVLRWLQHGFQESFGAEASGMAESVQQKVEPAGEKFGAAAQEGIKPRKPKDDNKKKKGNLGGNAESKDSGDGGGKISPGDGK